MPARLNYTRRDNNNAVSVFTDDIRVVLNIKIINRK